MTNDAIINGKTVTLTDEERAAAEQFHTKRLPFAFINGTLVFNKKLHDDRDHQHWLCEDFDLTVEQFEELPRGYILGTRIQLFKSSNFNPVDIPGEITDDQINELVNTYFMITHESAVSVFNGVTVGKVGELWPPIHTIGMWTCNWPNVLITKIM